MKRWLMILLSLALAVFPALSLAPNALADDQVGSFLPLDPEDYPKPVTRFPLGLEEGEPVSQKYWNDTVFIGDSITLKLQRYVAERRNAGEECLGRAKFLTAGSLGSGNALWEVNSESVHPSYQGEKMRVEKAVELMDAQKVYILLGMNDVAYFAIEESV